MKELSYLAIFTIVLLLTACGKETIPTNVELIAQTEIGHYVIDDYRTVVTDDGTLVIMDVNHLISFYDIQNQSPIGQPFFTFSLPGVNPASFISSMFHFDNKLWFMGTDTLYVYPSKPVIGQKPLRKITFENITAPRDFTLNNEILISNGIPLGEGLSKPFKADLSNLWNSEYENQVYIAPTMPYQGSSYETIIPRNIHNGFVFSNSAYGITICNMADLSVNNHLDLSDQAEFQIIEDKLFVISPGHIFLFDVSNPAEPKLLDSKNYSGLNMTISMEKKKLLVHSADEKIRSIDFSDPSELKLDRVYSIKGVFSMLGSMELKNNLIYLTAGNQVSAKLIVGKLKDF